MLKKILIANRGEIACRVIKTAKRLGFVTVAVYSDADKQAMHVNLADEAYHIGPAPSRESYLNADKLIEVAKHAGADCIHPGYGFLSENEAFADRCEREGIAFIGPSAASIEAMGSKTRAKEIMADANVPLVPGYYGNKQDADFLHQEAQKIGYPILIKAAYGGGGKGMRVVDGDAGFISALEGAKREASASFGNDLVLLERYVRNPRHVEVQVFADSHGNSVYLGDRDCSLQRRHQKVIEEAPAPGLSDQLRREMGEAAVRCARAIDYRGAGTVEFLLCGDEFFFMEMNTRLQVEHPVTEMVTGQDLVEWQLRVASGEVLPLTQEQIRLTGHSFEARIYAEDPKQEFIPCSGHLDAMFTPAQSNHVRIDTGVAAGSEISPFYDPMIAKLIVFDEDRPRALKRLANALCQFHIAGFSCNVEFLHNLAMHPEFAKGAPDTHFIERELDSLIADQASDHHICLALGALSYLDDLDKARHHGRGSAWDFETSFRLNQASTIVLPFEGIDISALAVGNSYQLNIDGQHVMVDGIVDRETINANIDGVKYLGHVVTRHPEMTVMYQSAQQAITLLDKHYISEHENEEAPLAAPLNGTVVKHLLEPGAEVEKGTPVVIIEAMKMEYTLNAPFDGTLTSYCFEEGALVSHGAMLAIVVPKE